MLHNAQSMDRVACSDLNTGQGYETQPTEFCRSVSAYVDVPPCRVIFDGWRSTYLQRRQKKGLASNAFYLNPGPSYRLGIYKL